MRNLFTAIRCTNTTKLKIKKNYLPELFCASCVAQQDYHYYCQNLLFDLISSPYEIQNSPHQYHSRHSLFNLQENNNLCTSGKYKET
jgi:hypothetical protein